ncbi:hypothetical protein AAC387_Pa09g0240 [Persea americana]
MSCCKQPMPRCGHKSSPSPTLKPCGAPSSSTYPTSSMPYNPLLPCLPPPTPILPRPPNVFPIPPQHLQTLPAAIKVKKMHMNSLCSLDY